MTISDIVIFLFGAACGLIIGRWLWHGKITLTPAPLASNGTIDNRALAEAIGEKEYKHAA